MAKKNKFKEFFKGYGEIFTSCYQDLADGYFNEGIEFIEHLLAWVGTAGLVMGTVTAIGTGAILPAVLLGLGSAALATDEAVHLTQKRPSIIVESLTKIVSAIMAPPLLLIGYPLVVASTAISSAIKEGRENRRERREAKRVAQATKDYAHEYVASETYESESTPATPTDPVSTGVAHSAPDFSHYYLADEPQPSSGKYIEELEESEPRLQPPTSDTDPQNFD